MPFFTLFLSGFIIIYLNNLLLLIFINFNIVRPNSSMMKVASKRLTDSNIAQRSIWEVKHAPGINVGRTD